MAVELNGAVVLVTGGTNGIGAAAAHRLAGSSRVGGVPGLP